jgi:hypothetical protein
MLFAKPQRVSGEEGSIVQRDGLFQTVAELPHISFPVLVGQCTKRFIRQSRDRLPYRLGKLIQEDLGEKRNISSALAQRGKMEDHPVQPEVQVLAKPTFRHTSPQIAIGSGHDTDIDGRRSSGAHSIE